MGHFLSIDGPLPIIPILRRDLSRINICESAWDRAHKDSIRAAWVSGRGASRKKNRSTLAVWPRALRKEPPIGSHR
eukprot:1155340-Pelagomonas_calceolata.AAC.1